MLVVLYLLVCFAVHSDSREETDWISMKVLGNFYKNSNTRIFRNTILVIVLEFWQPVELVFLNIKWNLTENNSNSEDDLNKQPVLLSLGQLNRSVLNTYCTLWTRDMKRKKSGTIMVSTLGIYCILIFPKKPYKIH